MKAILKKNPELDFLYGYFGGKPIPTKQDKFKPIIGRDIFEKIYNNFSRISTHNLYEKKEVKPTHKEFEKELRAGVENEIKSDKLFPILKPQKVEVVLDFSMTEKRLKEVDIDNLSKSILDCLNGLVFDDDSQVVNILSSKSVNPKSEQNGIMIGVRKVNEDNSNSWFDKIYLAYFEYEQDSKEKSKTLIEK